MKNKRRDFIKKSSLAATGLAVGVGCSSAKSYNRIMGANDTINVAVAGLNSRGNALLGTLLRLDKVNVTALCDVDSNVLNKRSSEFKEKTGDSVSTEKDFRKLLEDKSLDAVFIGSPDHTHAPFSIYSLQAGKHVYCEKPCSQTPEEGEMLVKAQKMYGKYVQIGNQQRSGPTSQKAMEDIATGIIGDVYEAKCWYANNRGSIGNGKAAAVPAHLDWDLWQGPAPRTAYMDNVVHYNWHWFKHWGTGEICNNGLHEMDICRWALGVDLPNKVYSQGGRYHFQNDDWEFFDTQIARFEYGGGKSLTWEGRSCNNHKQYERGRGTIIYGTEGSILLDRNAYITFDISGKEIKNLKEAELSQTTDLVGSGGLTDLHIDNFLSAIRTDTALHSPVAEANISNHLCHLGNMAQFAGKPLDIDPSTGKVLNDAASMQSWSRDYENGWAPKLA